MTSSEKIRPLYVIDTNTLYWYLTVDKKLGKNASSIFGAAERGETQIAVSAIVMAELFYLDKKWKMFQDFATTYQELRVRPEFLFVSFHVEDVLDFPKDSAVPEMHDRIIAGLARRLDAPLITVDPIITASGLVEVVW